VKTLLIGLLVVVALLLPSCTSQEDLQLAWNDGFQAGTDEGYQIGYDNGYSDGSDASYDTGYDEGYSVGHDDAFQDFWDAFAQAYEEYLVEGETTTGAWEDLLRIYGGEVEGEAEDDLYLIIVSITSSVYDGEYATLKAQTIPGALCTISVSYLVGMSVPPGLENKYADDEGNVSWTWKVSAMMGRYPVTVRSFDLSDPRAPSVYRTAYLVVKTEF
jgi:hypothetical protein